MGGVGVGGWVIGTGGVVLAALVLLIRQALTSVGETLLILVGSMPGAPGQANV